MSVPVIHTLAADSSGGIIELFGDAPLPSKLTVLIGLVIPLVSAYLSRRPSFITGILTVVIGVLASIATTWIAQGTTFDWGQALGTAVATVVTAWGAQARLYKDTPVVEWLYAHGLGGSDVDVTMLPPMQPGWDDVDNGQGVAPQEAPPAEDGVSDDVGEVDDDYDPSPRPVKPDVEG